MKKVAFIASVSGHIKCFHIPYLKYFKEKGYETYVVTGDEDSIEYCDKHIKVPFERSPFSKSTISAYRKLKTAIEKENFDIIHCHTPVAALLTRLAARKARKKGTRVLYTAHGFHFLKGGSVINWLIYFPVEWFASFFTDALITMNSEDYNISKKYFKAKKIHYVHGVGIDFDKISRPLKTKKEMREELSIPEDATLLLSVGELNKNKNQEVILKAMAESGNENLYYMIAGKGATMNHLLETAKTHNMADRFKLLGYRSDVAELLNCSDIFCFPSLREGLPVSVMEAMASGVPVIASKIRGNSDLIDDKQGGFLCNPSDYKDFCEKLKTLTSNKALCEKIIAYNKEKIKKFSLENVMNEMTKIYKEQENEL